MSLYTSFDIYHETNMAVTLQYHYKVNMLNEHMDPTFLSPTFQNTTNYNSHFTYYCQICPSNATYMINIQIRSHVIWENYVSMSTSYDFIAINNKPEALVYMHFTLLTYAPEQICLPHCKCTSHCTTTVVYMYTPTTAHTNKKIFTMP